MAIAGGHFSIDFSSEWSKKYPNDALSACYSLDSSLNCLALTGENRYRAKMKPC
ncbi:MAG: hypothetical protein CG439_640 [Methylococcaceae bacterium NSP1-2]|nr:MAG: hypothetical protein CG439_640 [Methylococcaceae bacterium NSP1-2]